MKTDLREEEYKFESLEVTVSSGGKKCVSSKHFSPEIIKKLKMHFITPFVMAAFAVIAMASPTQFKRIGLSMGDNCSYLNGNCADNGCQGQKSLTCTAVYTKSRQPKMRAVRLTLCFRVNGKAAHAATTAEGIILATAMKMAVMV